MKKVIAVDIETLYEIADAIQVHVEQLLYCSQNALPYLQRTAVLHF